MTLEAEKMQNASRWGEWLSSSGMRHRFFIVCVMPAMLQLCGNALISYYLVHYS